MSEKKGKQENKERHDKTPSLHWADQVADRVIREKGEKPLYTVAAGITPSGTVHIGNFREIITCDVIARALRKRGKKVRFLYSWDDYDVFRKVPTNMPKQDVLKTFLRKPIIETPDTFACQHESYAQHHELDIEQALPKVGIFPEFLYQHKKYRNGEYAQQIIQALENKDAIKAILNKYREEPLPENWLPVTVFSKKNGTDRVKNLAWDGKHILTYELEDGTTEKTDILKDGNVKLLWRIDWPMRWAYEKVDFEPGGKEHSTVGGSYTTAQEIVPLFGWTPPTYQRYDFIIVKGAGGKMSSSLGNVITLTDCLEVYEPQIIRWLFAGTRPNTEFAISFDTDVIKIYEDFDKCERICYGEIKVMNEKEFANQKRIYELSVVDPEKIPKTMPFQPSFRHLTNVLQQNDMDIDKTIGYYEKQLKNKEDKERLRMRATCAKNWLLRYAPEEFTFRIQKEVSIEVKKSLTKEQKAALHDLANALSERMWEDKELHEEFYIIMKNHTLEPNQFFTACYKILINKEKGPKLAAFLIEIKERAIMLLKSVS